MLEQDPNRRLGVGRVYDLSTIYNRLNRLYFDSNLQLSVRWGRLTQFKARTTVRLGSYCEKSKTITLSRRLDNTRVPMFFVEHVMFHEMLHAVFPSNIGRMHTEKFKHFEKLHPDYGRAIEWEKQNSSVLFSKAQTTLPF